MQNGRLTGSKARPKEIWYGIEPRSLEVHCVSHYTDGSLRMRGRDGLPLLHRLRPGEDAESEIRRFFNLSHLLVLSVHEGTESNVRVVALNRRAEELKQARSELSRAGAARAA